MTLKIRPFNKTDADYDACVGIANANWPEELSAVESWKHSDAHRNPERLFRRVVGEVDGRILESVFDVRWGVADDALGLRLVFPV